MVHQAPGAHLCKRMRRMERRDDALDAAQPECRIQRFPFAASQVFRSWISEDLSESLEFVVFHHLAELG